MKFTKTTLSKQLSACEPCVCLDLHPMCGGEINFDFMGLL